MRPKKLSVLFICLALLATAGGFAWGVASVVERIKSGNITNGSEVSGVKTEALNNFNFKDLLKTQLSKDEQGWTNFLFLGISGEDYISGNLSDTIMVATTHQETKRVNLISIPRDLWVSNPDGTFQKINGLYASAGGTEKPDVKATETIRQKVEAVTGLPLHYTVVINLEGIEKFVDFIGGVDTDEGHLNGKQALGYIRDRNRPGGDFDRMRRQQKLFVAIIKKQNSPQAKPEDEKTFDELYKIFSQYFSTDLALLQLVSLDKSLHDIEPERIGLYTITPDTGLLYSDQTTVGNLRLYTLHPKAGKENYEAIKTFIKQKLEKNAD